MIVAISVIKKWRFGTKMALLLSAMKSAEASITSIALCKSFFQQQTRIRNKRDMMAKLNVEITNLFGAPPSTLSN